MNKQEIKGLINKFSDVNILIIGDIMLDKYLSCEVTRLSGEAPVQIACVKNETCIPGGAANVANNIKSLGAKVAIVGLVGDDESGKLLVNEINKRGIDARGIVTDSDRPTTTKIRVIAHNQQLLRMDYERTHKVSAETCENIINFIKPNMKLYDIVVISDYSKGVVTKELMANLKRICIADGKKMVVDPKPKNMHLYNDVFIITPNHHEACSYAGIEVKDDNGHLREIGEKIQASLNTNVLITRGSKGMTLFERGESPTIIPARAKEVYDITGAGDTVVAALALSLASGSDLKTASTLSNYAAGVVVGKFGTSTLTKDELMEALDNK